MNDIAKKGNEIELVNPQQLMQMAIEKGAGIDVLERLMNLRERMQKDIAEKAFREAMSRFQAECPVIPKTKQVMNKDEISVRYKYAPIDEIITAVQPLLAKNDLSYEVKINLIQEPAAVEVLVKVFHILGHSSESSFSVPVDKESYMNAPQQWASAQTFAKRYALCNALGILTGDEDDDANGADKDKKEAEKKARKEAEEQAVKKKEAEKQAVKKKEAEKQEKIKKIEGLPENVKEGFRILGYNRGQVYEFCVKFEWNNAKILKEVNIIVDMKNKIK